MELKNNFTDTIRRHLEIQRSSRGCLICTNLPEEIGILESCAKIPSLEDIDFDNDPLLLPRLICDRAERCFSYRADFPDDSLSHISPRYGTGIMGGMLTGEMKFASNTSWFEPIGSDLDEVLDFTWGSRNKWIDIVVDSLNYMADRMRDKCYTFLEGYHSPLEFASMIRGSDLYLELCTESEKVHRLLRRCDDALMWLYDLLEEEATNKKDGILAYDLWMERGLPFLSDDMAGGISPEHYREFGIPYTNAMFARYGGGFLHIHTQAYHQMDNLSRMDSLTVHHWRQDPNTPEPGDILEQLLPGAQSKIVVIRLTPRQIREKINLLSRGRFIVWTTCENKHQQQEIIDLVRRKAPLEEKG